jgi:hypothetical protein
MEPLPRKQRNAGIINRFQPQLFTVAKKRKVIRKKETNAIPDVLILATRKNVYAEEEDTVPNLLDFGTDSTAMGDTPLNFLATPEIHDKYWSIPRMFGKEAPNYKQSLEFSKKFLNLPLNACSYQVLLAKIEGTIARRELQRWYR